MTRNPSYAAVRIVSLQDPFNLVLSRSIDSVLAEVLGVKVREAIYDNLARNVSLAKEEIPQHLDELSDLFENIFGKGACVLERCIARKLCRGLGRDFLDIPHLRLQHYVALLKRILAQGDDTP